jgi:hypothetical protein
MFATKEKGPRYLEMAEGYVTRVALNKDNEIVGYEFVNLGKLMDLLKAHPELSGKECLDKIRGHYGQWDNAAKYIDPRHE